MRSYRGRQLVIGLLLFFFCSESQQTSSQCSPCHDPEQSLQCEDVCPEHFCHLPDYDTSVCQPPVAATVVTTQSSQTRPPTTMTAITIDDGNSTGGNSTRVQDGVETTTSSTAGPTTTRAATTTQAVNETQASNLTATTTVPSNDTEDTATPSLPTTLPPRLLRCLPLCLRGNCSTCTGNDPNNCPGYRQDYKLTTDNGTIKCIPKKKREDSGYKVDVAVIAGASAGGGVVLIGVLVLVACLCCRRRHRAWKQQEQGPGMLGPHGVSSPPSQEDQEKGDDVEMRNTQKPSRVEIPEYVNITSTMPRPVSIERGHDKVTRYVRDPTVKPQKPESAASTVEEQELAELPTAPLPPGPRKGGRTEPENPTARTPARSHTTAANTGSKQEAWRRKDPYKAATLPVSSPLPGKESDFPRFPFEEDEPEDQSAAAAAAVSAEELEDPEDEYENVKTKLATPADEKKELDGINNPALDIGEEPEDEYANQAAIQEMLNSDDNLYENLRHQKQY